MMNLPDFGLNTSQSSSGDFNMDTFANYTFGSFLDQDLQPSYANDPQHTESIRPSDLDAGAYNNDDSNNIAAFGASHPTEISLQIDPSLTESKGVLGQQEVVAPPLTPASLSPESFDAVRSRPRSLTGVTVSGKSDDHKRKASETDHGDADAERRLKNRVAASKCRVKKKGREQLLVQESDQQKHENAELKAELKRLTQEALWYKNQIILHGNCGDARINQWLTNSAAKIVHNNFGEGPAFQRDVPSIPAARPSAKLQYDRKDSGISTNSKAGLESSPRSGQPLSVKIGLGSPVDGANPQDVHVSPKQSKFEQDTDLMGGAIMRRAKSLDYSTMDAFAKTAANRASSIPLQDSDSFIRSDPDDGDGAHHDPSVEEGKISSVSAGPPGGADGTPTVVWDAQLSDTAMTIDPRLRGEGMPLQSLNTNAGSFGMPVPHGEQNHDELLQIPGTKWMED